MTRPVVAAYPWATIGRLIAFLVLIIDIVLIVTNAVELKLGLLIAGLAVAEIVP